MIRILNYFDVFDDFSYYVNIKTLSIGYMVFAILWLILALYNVFRCHSFVKGWNNLEKQFSKREQIFRQYENLYLELNKTSQQKREMEQKREMLEYFLIRQEFISPTFLPVLGEGFLRDDFNFATYLSKALAKTSYSMFKYSFASIMTILLIGSTWLLFIDLDTEVQIMIMGFVPTFIFILLYGMEVKLNNIYKMLVHIVDSPYEVNFTKFDNIRQPFANLDKLKVPLYLSGKDEKPHNPSRYSNLINKVTF